MLLWLQPEHAEQQHFALLHSHVVYAHFFRSRAQSYGRCSAAVCAVIAFEASSGTELRLSARTSENHFLKCPLAPLLAAPSAAACEPLCKMLSCSWESLEARQDASHESAIGDGGALRLGRHGRKNFVPLTLAASAAPLSHPRCC